MARGIRFGVQTAPQNTTWPELRDTWRLIDSLGYDKQPLMNTDKHR
jgi:hypothetical protein